MAEKPSKYTWDQRLTHGLGAYRDTATGHIVKASVARGAIFSHLDNGDMVEWTKQLQGGAVDLSSWQNGMRKMIKDNHVLSVANANGGWSQMGPKQYGFAGAKIKEQYKYLDGWANDIASGKAPMDGRMLNRAAMYENAAYHTYSKAQEKIAVDQDFDQRRSVLDPASKSCSGCIAAANLGWVDIDDPALPDLGKRDCLANDRCTMEYRKKPDELEELTDTDLKKEPSPGEQITNAEKKVATANTEMVDAQVTYAKHIESGGKPFSAYGKPGSEMTDMLDAEENHYLAQENLEKLKVKPKVAGDLGSKPIAISEADKIGKELWPEKYKTYETLDAEWEAKTDYLLTLEGDSPEYKKTMLEIDELTNEMAVKKKADFDPEIDIPKTQEQIDAIELHNLESNLAEKISDAEEWAELGLKPYDSDSVGIATAQKKVDEFKRIRTAPPVPRDGGALYREQKAKYKNIRKVQTVDRDEVMLAGQDASLEHSRAKKAFEKSLEQYDYGELEDYEMDTILQRYETAKTEKIRADKLYEEWKEGGGDYGLSITAQTEKVEDWYARGENRKKPGWDSGYDNLEERTQKIEICDDIAARTGTTHEMSREYISEWAANSNNRTYISMNIQDRASQIFDEDMSGWQKERYNEQSTRRLKALMEHKNLPPDQKYYGLDDDTKILSENIGFPTKSTAPNYDHPEGVVDAMLNATYEGTQNELDTLRAKGVTHVKLYRGIELKRNQYLAQGEYVTWDSNTLESWSLRKDVASDFAGSSSEARILEVSAPLEQVFSTARTGTGCLNEFEFILIKQPGQEFFVQKEMEYDW